ncbi:MAG: hypothetical protein EGQ71_01350 [Dialister sp.]|nr:hypothetical protein [Dialister sp.]
MQFVKIDITCLRLQHDVKAGDAAAAAFFSITKSRYEDITAASLTHQMQKAIGTEVPMASFLFQ